MFSIRTFDLFELFAPVIPKRQLVAAACVLVAHFFSMRTSFAVDDYDPAARRAIEAMLASRAELKSGKFHAVGKNTVFYKNPERMEETASVVHCVFDTPGKRMRFERRGQIQIDLRCFGELSKKDNDQIGSGTFTPKPRTLDMVCMYVRSPEYMATWESFGHKGDSHSARSNVEIRKPDGHPSSRTLCPFHYTAVGLFTQREYEEGKTAAEIIEEPLGGRSTTSVVEVEHKSDENGILHVVFRNHLMKRTVEIDTAQGFTVRHMEIVGLDKSRQPMPSKAFESSASWEEVDGIWVPTHFATTKYRTNGDAQTHEYDINWEAVNPQTLDDDLFTYQSFEGVWDNVYVFDNRGDKPAHIDTFGRPFEPMGLPQPTGEAGLATHGAAKGGGHAVQRKYWLIGVNLIAVLALLLFFGWKRFRKVNSN